MDNFQPKSRIGLVGAWFATALTCLLFAILFTFYILNTRLVQPTSQSFNLFAALPEESTQVSEEIKPVDGRAKSIENFFKKVNSPLADHSQAFVDVADKYSLDYKLLPAIAMQESKGGQKVIKDSYNPFGYGIYGNFVIKFSGWQEGIERVGKALREEYINEGLKTPSEIMVKYTPPSLATGGTWAKSVNSFMEQLR